MTLASQSYFKSSWDNVTPITNSQTLHLSFWSSWNLLQVHDIYPSEALCNILVGVNKMSCSVP